MKVSGFGGSESQGSDFGFWASGFGLLIFGFEIFRSRISGGGGGVGSQVLGFEGVELLVSGLGSLVFRVSGLRGLGL